VDATIRAATDADLPRLTDIYNHYIDGSHVSFDVDPWTLEHRQEWFATYAPTGRYRVLVLETADGVVGAAWSSPFRPKAAYDTSVETTIVLDPAVIGRGLGKRLLTALLDELATEDVHRAYAIIALPNDASIALHHRLGYRSLGVQHEVGRMYGAYWDTELLEKRFP
jgi:phosphinothricin acetyltransferase